MGGKSRPSTAGAGRTAALQDHEVVLKQILAPEFISSGLSWARSISQKEKQGLRILKAVMKHRGQKKFRAKAKMPEEAQKSLMAQSALKLDRHNLEQYKKEYKQGLFKSAYGNAFGRKESDLAGTGILSHKRFSELPSCKVLNTTAKAYINRWVDSGEDQKYVSLAIVVVKGIFTHWKEALPSDTVSHLKHAWYNSHDIVHSQTMEKASKSVISSGFSNTARSERPQTSSNMFEKKGKESLIPNRTQKYDKGMDKVISDRKKLLLRGNGNITGFYQDPLGMVSSYQSNYQTTKDMSTIKKTAGNNYISSIMVVTPDPGQLAKVGQKQNKFKKDVNSATKKLAKTESAMKQAMGRMMEYQEYPEYQPSRGSLGMRVGNPNFQSTPEGFPMRPARGMNPYRHLKTSG
ncbi:unnamed protein product [Moneuplotes crassus]|uniref:Uncharacterized protein n=1 Tax=Euplotes crassus TaxID=5936 RepID=A0AAD1XGI2_EUPCR|nr:unnamed protein product [Moneuplotes crassus]